MLGLITQIIEATSCREVDRIVDVNLLKISPYSRATLCNFANRAKMRITRIERMKKETWKEQLN